MYASNNFEFWGTPECAERMYDKYVDALEPDDLVPSVYEWLYKKCDFALQLKVGDVVQYNQARADEAPNVRYAKVAQINRDKDKDARFVTFGSVGITYAGDESTTYRAVPNHRIHGRDERNLPPYHIKWADVPEDLLRLMVGRLATACPSDMKERCPFRDEWKEPVPPCMKEDAE